MKPVFHERIRNISHLPGGVKPGGGCYIRPGIFSLFFRFTLLCIGLGAVSSASRGDLHAAAMLLFVVVLWNWRWILDYVVERRWRL